MPTADKPQSKLWFMDGCWWALLPRSSGPSLWQRTNSAWKEHTEVARGLHGVPGRADVWPESSGATVAALAEHGKTNRSVTVFRLTRAENRWETQILAELLPPDPHDLIETATLIQDTCGNWWVAAVARTKVCVWHASSPGTQWSSAIVVADGVDQDDICVLTPLSRRRIGVLWSDQVRDAVVMRAHVDGASAEDWCDEEVAAIGNKTADDHLNTVLLPDGRLWVASKNEVDTAGQPQFVLRSRSADGIWSNWPYGIREDTTRPSRPMVVAAEAPSVVFTGYGDNDRALPFPHKAEIVFAQVGAASSEMVAAPPRKAIAPDDTLDSYVHNVTGPRHPFPEDAPWLVLASDQEGRVYEADLRDVFPEALDSRNK